MANLVSNPSFESCTPPALTPDWASVGTGNATTQNTGARTGTICVDMKQTGGPAEIEQINIPTSNGVTYLFGVYLNPSTAATLNVSINASLIGSSAAPVTGTYTLYTYLFVATGTSTLNISITGDSLLDDVSITENVICFPGRTLVYAQNVENDEEKYVRADELNKDVHNVFSLEKLRYVPIKNIVTCGPYNRFFLLKKNSLSEYSPNEDLYLTSGHKILYHGTETKVRDVPETSIVKGKPEKLYSIVTGESEPLLINNAPVFSHLDEYNNQ